MYRIQPSSIHRQPGLANCSAVEVAAAARAMEAVEALEEGGEATVATVAAGAAAMEAEARAGLTEDVAAAEAAGATGEDLEVALGVARGRSLCLGRVPRR
jgi:hypothetical protein